MSHHSNEDSETDAEPDAGQTTDFSNSPDQVAPEVSDPEIRRWDRQLKATDPTIFPPGYGEDAIFAESFEIDDRLKKKRNQH